MVGRWNTCRQCLSLPVVPATSGNTDAATVKPRLRHTVDTIYGRVQRHDSNIIACANSNNEKSFIHCMLTVTNTSEPILIELGKPITKAPNATILGVVQLSHHDPSDSEAGFFCPARRVLAGCSSCCIYIPSGDFVVVLISI
jgi:hypothetical protein